MKCQHCGVNFDDSEKVCPLCGAKAGSRGRMSEPKKPVWHGKPRETYTEYHPTIANDSDVKPLKDKVKSAHSTSRPLKERKVKGSKKGALIVVGIIVFMQFIPVLAGIVLRGIDSISSLTTSLRPEAQEYEYEWFSLYDIMGANSTVTLQNGDTLSLTLGKEKSTYELLYTAADGSTFQSTGTTWCSYENNEDYYPMDFPYSEYAQYVVSLSPDIQAADSTAPDWCQNLIEDNSSIWFTMYVNRHTNEIVLEDMDGIGIFGTSMTASVNETQNM